MRSMKQSQKKAKDVYIVHKGVTLGQHVVDLMYVNAGEPFRYKIYEGKEFLKVGKKTIFNLVY